MKNSSKFFSLLACLVLPCFLGACFWKTNDSKEADKPADQTTREVALGLDSEQSAATVAANTDATSQEYSNKDAELITLPSGLAYKILEAAPAADAPTPEQGARIVVHYTGWLEDKAAPESKGAKFDSSVDRGEPLVFNIGVGQVIEGWDKGLEGMKAGESRRLFIPAALAYGERGAGDRIPANANLIFDVQLLQVS